MKVLAMYLPQFHRVKENNEWWGDGFTEWTSVKAATPLYEGHMQPRVPLNDNYYDLLQKQTMKWQADLMHQYGVDGMCFYHYWFKEGRQILEKPAENLLAWKDINMPFCFCWANETWARSWSNVRNAGVWTNKYEKEPDIIDDGILLEQKYGDENDWKEHFDYLEPFFKDERYVKQDNKPVFVLYKPELVSCLNEMLSKWQEWALESGLEGIYFVGVGKCEKRYESIDISMYLEPSQYFMKTFLDKKRESLVYNYSDVWKSTLSHIPSIERVTYCGVVGFDDTPRRGIRGRIIEGQTPELFKQYLTELLAKNEVANSPFTFINAWNEWGEGMYLEPDEKDGYAYLEAIPYAKEHYKEYIEKYKKQLENPDEGLLKEYKALSERCAKYEGYWRILDAWLCNKEDGVSLETYFIKQGIKSIAIYGGGMLGKHLLEELKGSSITVAYVIDRKADALKLGIPVYSIEDKLPEVDAIVVSATFAYAEIKLKLQEKGCEKIVSLENIIMEI